MDFLTLLRTLGGLAAVLGMLAFALWAVRRFDIRLPGRVAAGGAGRRLQLVERTSLDSRRSVALLRRDGREHLILLSPEGNLILETSIVRDEVDAAAEEERLRAEAEAMALSKAEMEALRESFSAFVDRTRSGVRDKVEGAVSAAGSMLRVVQAEPEAPTPSFNSLIERGQNDAAPAAAPMSPARPAPLGAILLPRLKAAAQRTGEQARTALVRLRATLSPAAAAFAGAIGRIRDAIEARLAQARSPVPSAPATKPAPLGAILLPRLKAAAQRNGDQARTALVRLRATLSPAAATFAETFGRMREAPETRPAQARSPAPSAPAAKEAPLPAPAALVARPPKPAAPRTKKTTAQPARSPARRKAAASRHG